MVPRSIRTVYGTVRPFTVVTVASGGVIAGSGSAANVPLVVRYWKLTTGGAAQFGGVAGARPNAVVSQKNGTCCGPLKTGPVTGWLTTRTAAGDPRRTVAVITLLPSGRPSTRPSLEPSGWTVKALVTSRRPTRTVTWPGPVTRTSADPPLTRVGFGLETTTMSTLPLLA